jgi:PhzF family phenazine biosynthesis protein
MPHTLHIIDAFTDKPFHGNPAAVCVLEAPADEAWMKLAAREMNLSETAFLHPRPRNAGDSEENTWDLRWFTQTVEVELCGHATLASAFTLWHTGKLSGGEPAKFHTLSGVLTCTKRGDWIEMDFPAKPATECAAPVKLAAALGNPSILWTGMAFDNYLVELASEAELRALKPDFNILASFAQHGVIVTAAAAKKVGGAQPTTAFDFVSRYFAPSFGINEDPATGSAHCTSGPYWAHKLGKNELSAYQASTRGGTFKLRVNGDRITIAGQAVMMSTVQLMHSK